MIARLGTGTYARFELSLTWGVVMRGIVRAGVCLALLASGAVFSATPASAAPPPSRPGGALVTPSDMAAATDQMIVHFRDGATPDAGALMDPAGDPVDLKREMGDGSWVIQLGQRYAPDDAEALAAIWEQRPDVEYAEPDARMFTTLVPNDPQYSSQWHYQPVALPDPVGANLPAAWDITTGTNSSVVAVLDTGYLNHADLTGRFAGGYDMISNVLTANDGGGRDASALDPGDWVTSAEAATGQPFAGCQVRNSSWHGTHVSGTIGANSNNSVGVAGIDWNAKILPVRVLGKCGGSVSDIADGIRWAAGLSVPGVPANPNVAKVINMSLGGTGVCGTTYQDAIDAATGAGSLVVVAAGNSNVDMANARPANCNNVLAVAATADDGWRAGYSNFGTGVDIAAPGGDFNYDTGVLSTANGGTTSPGVDTYAAKQGTSMATPHVAGVASLVRAVNPSLTPAQLTTLLKANVTPFPAGTDCTTSLCGSGILNAGAAVAAAQSAARLRVTTNPALPADIIVDGTARDSWGLNWAEFPPGPHQVCFGAVPGYTKPGCQDVNLTAGNTTTVQGTYAQNGFLRVITSPAVASTISVGGVARNDWGLWAEVAPGTYNVCFGAVQGFDVPACRDVVVTAGSTGVTTGTFAPNPSAPGPGGTFGFLRATTSPAVGSMISVDGTWRNNWGLDWVKLPTGAHQVCYGAAPNMTAPASCQDINITNGATTEVSGTYAPKGFLRVLTSPSVQANITVNGVVANAYGMWHGKAPGSYNVCFGPVPGFVTPPCQNAVAVTANNTTTITGTYTASP